MNNNVASIPSGTRTQFHMNNCSVNGKRVNGYTTFSATATPYRQIRGGEEKRLFIWVSSLRRLPGVVPGASVWIPCSEEIVIPEERTA